MKLLRGYIYDHAAHADEYLQQFHVSRDAESLHRFRVEIKKLRAALKMLRTLSPRSRKLKKTSQQLRKIFLHAGEIRRMQLRLAWLKKHKLSVLIQSSSLNSLLMKEIDQLQLHAKSYGKELERMANVLKKWAGEAKYVAVKKQATALTAQLADDLDAKDVLELHKIRKRIKQLMYAQTWLNKDEKQPALTRSMVRKLDALQESIGAWHDLQDHLLWLESEKFHFQRKIHLRKASERCKSTLEKLSAAAVLEIRRKMSTMKIPIR